MQKKFLGHHGDVAIFKVDKLPENLIPVRGNVLYSSTGQHEHAFTSQDASVFKDQDGNIFFTVKKQVELSHEEHATVTIEKGVYSIEIEQTRNPFTKLTEKVID